MTSRARRSMRAVRCSRWWAGWDGGGWRRHLHSWPIRRRRVRIVNSRSEVAFGRRTPRFVEA